VGLDTFDALNNEFQRADCAPYATLGNGSMAATDVTQARRYQLGTDPAQPAGGANGPASFAPAAPKQADAPKNAAEVLPRVVRVVNVSTSPGSQVTVTLQADAEGDENNYGFSLGYETAILSNPVVTIGADATGGNVLANPTTMAGKIGFSVDFGSGTMPAGNAKRLVTVKFDVAPTAPAGHTPLTFGDAPAVRETSNLAAQPVATSYEDGFVNIAGPTAASVSVGGRVMKDNEAGLFGALVYLSDNNGVTRTAKTNPFGYFRFDNVRTGASYMISIRAKSYRFDSRVITVQDELTDLVFTPTSQ
jgi:hypothetical protein